jgi:hypothetical protein
MLLMFTSYERSWKCVTWKRGRHEEAIAKITTKGGQPSYLANGGWVQSGTYMCHSQGKGILFVVAAYVIINDALIQMRRFPA